MTLQDMVAGQSVSQSGADVLRGIGAGRHSYLVYSPPRNAGKSTLTQAILNEAPADVPRRSFLGTVEEFEALSADPRPGYLVVAEIGHRGVRGYLAGDEVERVFGLVARGWALSSCLHAGTVDEVYEVLGRNGISPEAAASVRYLAKVLPLGDPNAPGCRRVVEHVHEITGVTEGRPVSTCLYRWDGDRRAG